MRVLLITTSPNSVLDHLEKILTIGLQLVDCKDHYTDIGKRIEISLANRLPDVILSYRCPYILPEFFFTMARWGAYNIHPSLLPKYPGLNPWKDIFTNKENINGVTLHKITGKTDQGEIVYQKSYSINSHDTMDTARQKADYIAAELAVRLINDIQSNK